MIRIGKLVVEPRTGAISQYRERPKSANQIFIEVKSHRGDLIRAHKITDQELNTLISKIKGGTRNIMYLGKGDDLVRFRDIVAYIIREYEL